MSAPVRKRKKKVLLAKVRGMTGRKNRCVDLSKGPGQRRERQKTYGRRLNRRDRKCEGVIRCNALLRSNGLKYSQHIPIFKDKIEQLCGYRMGIQDICFVITHNPDLMHGICRQIAVAQQ
jgi:ribosomal protein L20